MQALTGETFPMRDVEVEVVDAFERLFSVDLREESMTGAAVGS